MNNKEKKIYTPESTLKSPLNLIRAMFVDLRASQELAIRLSKRDIKARYRQSILGFLWIFIIPLANTLVWVFLNKSGIVNIAETNVPYPIYVFSGTMLWQIFAEAVNAPLSITLQSKSMLSKINFPKEALILSGIYQTTFNGIVKIIIILITLIFYGILPGISILFLPLGFLFLIITGTSLGLILTPIGVLYSDVGKALPLIMQFFMYLTPVLFVIPEKGLARAIYLFNPITSLIEITRNSILNQSIEMLAVFSIVCISVLVLLFIGWFLYRVTMPILVERMTS